MPNKDNEHYSWDQYFYDICCTVAKKSNCMSRKVGAIIVSDNSILCTGYNGPARGGIHCCDRKDIHGYDGKSGVCPRRFLGFKSGEGLDLCPAVHGEVNAIVNAARHGVKAQGTTMYMNCTVPCYRCLITIINAGIKEIVVTGMEYYDELAPYILHGNSLGNLYVRKYEWD